MDLDGLTTVVVDTSTCIYYLDGAEGDRRRLLATRVFEHVDYGTLTVLLSPVTVTELLVRPIRLGDVRTEAFVRLFVARQCTVADASAITASHAAEIRTRHNLRTADAFILAIAREHAVDAVIGNDVAWKRASGVRYLHIDDFT